jgi:hypothetical protein
MSRGFVFRYDPRSNNPDCDVCRIPTLKGATLIHLVDRPGVAVMVLCTTCAVEIAFTVVREFWPHPPPDLPPEAPPASGGGSK